jgi:hypothetical protein
MRTDRRGDTVARLGQIPSSMPRLLLQGMYMSVNMLIISRVLSPDCLKHSCRCRACG